MGVPKTTIRKRSAKGVFIFSGDVGFQSAVRESEPAFCLLATLTRQAVPLRAFRVRPPLATTALIGLRASAKRVPENLLLVLTRGLAVILNTSGMARGFGAEISVRFVDSSICELSRPCTRSLLSMLFVGRLDSKPRSEALKSVNGFLRRLMISWT